MEKRELLKLLSGEVLEEDIELSLVELCHACQLSAERIIELVEEGVIEPLDQPPGVWRFQGVSIRRVRFIERLERDLGVNTAGAALSLELIEEIERLRRRLRLLERD